MELARKASETVSWTLEGKRQYVIVRTTGEGIWRLFVNGVDTMEFPVEDMTAVANMLTEGRLQVLLNAVDALQKHGIPSSVVGSATLVELAKARALFP